MKDWKTLFEYLQYSGLTVEEIYALVERAAKEKAFSKPSQPFNSPQLHLFAGGSHD